MIKALRLTLSDDDLARGDGSKIKCPPTIVLPDGVNVVYIEMGGTTYYLDDSTGEAMTEPTTTTRTEAQRKSEVDSLKELERAINCTPSGIRFNKYHVTDGTTKVRVRYSYSVNGRTVGHQLPYVTLYAKDCGDGLGTLFGDLYINETDTVTDYFDKGKVVLEEGHSCYDLALARAKEWEKQAAADQALATEYFKATS